MFLKRQWHKGKASRKKYPEWQNAWHQRNCKSMQGRQPKDSDPYPAGLAVVEQIMQHLKATGGSLQSRLKDSFIRHRNSIWRIITLFQVVRKLNLSHAYSTTATSQDAQFNSRLWKNESSLHRTLETGTKRKTENLFGAAGTRNLTGAQGILSIHTSMWHHPSCFSRLLNRWS